MDAGKGIYWISASLVAGVLAAAVSFQRAPREAFYFTAAILSALCWAGAGIATFRLRKKQLPHPVFIALLFLATGAFCYVNRAVLLPGTGESSLMQLVQRTAAAVSGAIAGIPFKDGENNALLQALVLGSKDNLSRATTVAFRNAGAAHLLALSGMHLGIIYLIISKVLVLAGNSAISRKCRSAVIILLTGAYTLMCGSGPSLVRAWLFILLNESGRILDRPQKPEQVFCTALTLHLVTRPESIMSIGFQLSYLAMVGIVFLWPRARKLYQEAGGSDGDTPVSEGTLGQKIWDGASLSICAQAFTSPLTMIYFGTFPKYFLITNLFAAPLMGVVMVCGLTSLLFAAAGADAPLLYSIMELPLSALRTLLDTIAGM